MAFEFKSLKAVSVFLLCSEVLGRDFDRNQAESQGQHLALTLLYVPYSLNSGLGSNGGGKERRVL